MNFGIMEALNQITRERRVDKALLYETLEAGLTQAIKKKFGNNAVVKVQIDEESGSIDIIQRKKVVERVTDPENEIALKDALEEFGDELEPGDIV